jgi:hypothetical protein
LRPCLQPGCPRLVRRGRCPAHSRSRQRQQAQAKRAAPARGVYDDPRWQETRARALERAGGRCQMLEGPSSRCPERQGLHGHHDYRGGVEQMLVDGLDPFDDRHVVVLCGHHHGQVEAAARRTRKPARGR